MTKANIFMAAGWAGLAGIACVLLSAIEGIPPAIAIIGSVIAVAACWAMMFTRNADEYTQGLWTAAASTAFAIMLILFISIPFFEGMYDGFTDAGPEAAGMGAGSAAIYTIASAIAGFYIGLFWKRLAGI